MCEFSHIIATICMLMALGGCGNLNSKEFSATEQQGYNKTFIKDGFYHWAIEHIVSPSHETLHVYIEGDGVPWVNENIVNDDPTPKNPLTLSLMQLDNTNAIYLGRPCYFANYLPVKDSKCNPHYWTDARYSQTVVSSMINALNSYARENGYSKLVLIGYSGGGVIATMMACHLPYQTTLVTIAANLDVAAWTQLHGYSPLTLSLDPAKDFFPCRGLTQYHFAAADDWIVPPQTAAKFFERTHSRLNIFANADHNCCWSKKWQEILSEIR
jgi:hypothetical protein